MTYNFDPERWYDNEYAILAAEKRAGRLSEDAFKTQVDELIRRYDAMCDRLDGTYRVGPEAEC